MYWLLLLTVVLAVLCVVVVLLGSLVFALLRQHGRLLVRVDQLEEAIDSRQTDGRPPQGLPVGVTVPAFELPGMRGGSVGSQQLAGQRALLVNWDFDCGFCQQIVPDLVAVQADLSRRRTALVLLSRGDASSNLEQAERMGLECQIALAPSSGSGTFGSLGTPAAYLLDEQGRVARPLALGALEVPALVREAASGRRQLATERPLSESRVERNGLKGGAPAPPFSLTDLDGGTVSLEDYRGRRVLLVFSDPSCGPCQALMSDLASLDSSARERLAVVMITRGDRDENLEKREQYTAAFPIAIQPGWSVSKLYGIFSTPVAFLIGEDGIIERDVAKGPPEIMDIARSVLAASEEVVQPELQGATPLRGEV